MRKGYLVILLPLLVLILAGTSYAWQGRMGGMGDPYGLVSDEADFLIHPAKIANGEGVKFYGDYRFTYTGVTSWNINYNGFDFDASGQEYKHDALVGAAFPLGAGRMGLLFEYAGKRGDYEGDSFAFSSTYDLTSDRDNFALRLLYGLPVGGFSLGGEVQLAYRQEENKTWWGNVTGVGVMDYYNYFGFSTYFYIPSITPFITPYDSAYWEALFKGSVEGKVGPLDLELTLRGGFLFGGDNEFDYAGFISPGTFLDGYDLDGNVRGWRIGGDFWLRYPLKDGFALPFLVRIDYQEKTRDGDGQGTGNLAGLNYDYKHKEKSLQIEIGGGVDKELASSTRIAAGLYYDYIRGANEVNNLWIGSFTYNHYPASTEHRVLIRLAGEHEISPSVTLRMGLKGFYGWARENYESSFPFYLPPDSSLDGSHWGIEASLGGTIKVKPITLEPFITGGYQSLDLSGESDDSIRNIARNEWLIGGGFSVLFDVP